METTMIPLDKITVEQGFNPRTTMEAKELEGLARSVKEHGLLNPVQVEQTENGGFLLTAGHRRYAAAQLAGLSEIPAQVRSDGDDRLVISLIENIQREQLNPVDEAGAYQRMLESGLTTTGIAEKTGMSVPRITQRLGLLELGPVAQRYASKDELPLSIVPQLKTIAAINKKVSDVIAEIVAEKQVEPATFKKAPLEVFARIQASKIYPSFVTGRRYDREIFELSPEVEEKIDGLGYNGRYIAVEFTEDDLDKARAHGVAAFVKDGKGVILDFPFAKTLAEDIVLGEIERIEKHQAEGAEREENRRKEARAPRDERGAPILDPEKAKAARKEERDEKAEQARQAVAFNDELGRALFKSAGKLKLTQETATVISSAILAGHAADYVMRGLRFVHPNLRDVQVNTLKSGETRTKIEYVDRAGAEKAVRDFVNNASSPEELLGRTLMILLAARLADERAIAQSKRSGSLPHRGTQVALDDLAEAILPEEIVKRAQSHISEIGDSYGYTAGWKDDSGLEVWEPEVDDPDVEAMITGDPGPEPPADETADPDDQPVEE